MPPHLAGVATIMLLCGTFFLAYTIELSRLLLQTVVLSFVMVLDELVYASLAPEHGITGGNPPSPTQC